MAGMIVHHEILREQLQHHAVFLQLHARGAVHHAVHVALLDLAHVPEFDDAAAVGAAHRGAAHPDDRRFHRDAARPPPPRAAPRESNRPPRVWSAIRPFSQPCDRHRAASQKAHAAVFQHADHHPRLAAARVQSTAYNRFLLPFRALIPLP